MIWFALCMIVLGVILARGWGLGAVLADRLRSAWARCGPIRAAEVPSVLFLLMAGAAYRRELRDILRARRALASTGDLEKADREEWERRLAEAVGPLCEVCRKPIAGEDGKPRAGSICVGDPDAGRARYWHGDCGPWAQSEPPAMPDTLRHSDAFRPATVDEYVAWLRGYMLRGGKIRYARDYPMTDDVVFALRDFTTAGERGAATRHIIVPGGVTHLGGDLGHCILFHMSDYSAKAGHGPAWVAVYSNPEFDAVPGVPEARQRIAAERADRLNRMSGDLATYRRRT